MFHAPVSKIQTAVSVLTTNTDTVWPVAVLVNITGPSPSPSRDNVNEVEPRGPVVGVIATPGGTATVHGLDETTLYVAVGFASVSAIATGGAGDINMYPVGQSSDSAIVGVPAILLSGANVNCTSYSAGFGFSVPDKMAIACLRPVGSPSTTVGLPSRSSGALSDARTLYTITACFIPLFAIAI